jgi:hypothetical protein
MRAVHVFLFACFCLLSSTTTAFSHHSFAAEYDPNKTLQVKGTVTKVEWMNPHARFYVDVRDDQGEVTNWNFELGSITLLQRLGWRRNSLQVGEQVTVQGYPAKDGSKRANARSLVLADGRKIFAGSSADSSYAK